MKMEKGALMPKSVSSVVWPWRTKAVGLAAAGEAGNPRGRAAIQAGVMGLVGLLAYAGLDKPGMGIVVWSLAAAVLLSGFFFPPAFFALERLGQRLGHWVGAGLTWGVLVPFYYLCFGAARLMLAVRGKDPLHREFKTSEPTYWTPRPPIRDEAQYRKQF